MLGVTKALLSLLVIAVTCHSAFGFRRDCSKVKCPSVDCEFGSTFSYYHCCNVCYKAEGEICGGLWVQDGYCADGLTCVLDDPTDPNHSAGVCQP